MNKSRWLRIFIVAFIIGTMLIPSLPSFHVNIPQFNVSLPEINVPWYVAQDWFDVARNWGNKRITDVEKFIARDFNIGPQPAYADSANLYAVVGQATATTGTATVTGSPARFTTAGGTIMVTTGANNQTFTVTTCAGTSAIVTSGTATITSSPKSCLAGAATTVTVSNTITNGTCTIAVTYASTGLWSNAYSWSSISGGTPNNHVIPTSTNPVFFDTNSFGGAAETFTNDVAAQACASMDWSAVSNNPIWAGTTTLSIYGSYTGTASMTKSYSGTITWASTAVGKTITSSQAWPGAMTFNGAGGGWTFNDAFNIGTGTLTLTNGALNDGGQTVTCGTFTTASGTNSLIMGASVWNVSSATGWVATNLDSVTAGSASIRLTGTNAPFTGNGFTYYEVQLNGQTQTMSGINTFTNLIRTGAAIANDTLIVSNNFTVTGTLTLTGSSTSNRLALKSNTTSARTVTSAANTFTYVDFYYITGAGAGSWNVTAITGGSADMGGNSNITFTDISYWVGAAGLWISGAGTHWAGTSGGTANADWLPVSTSSARFDGSSGFTSGSKTVTVDNASAAICFNMDWTGAYGASQLYNSGNGTLEIDGSFTSVTGLSVIQYVIHYYGTGTCNITTLGTNMASQNTVFGAGTGGTFNLLDNYTCTGATGGNSFYVGVGATFNFNNYNVATDRGVSFSNGTVNMGSGTLTMSGGNTNNTFTGGAGVNVGTSTIIMNTSSTGSTFAGGGYTYNNVILHNTSNTIAVTGSNTFNNLTKTGAATLTDAVTFDSDQIITGTFTATGYSGVDRLLIASSIQGTLRNISAGSVAITNCDLSDISTSTGSWNISTGNNGNIGGNIGITFTTASNIYWVGNTGSWIDALHWASSSGGVGGSTRVPLVQDTAIFDANSAVINSNVSVAAGVRMSSIDASLALYYAPPTNTGYITFNATNALLYGTYYYIGRSQWVVTTTYFYCRGNTNLYTEPSVCIMQAIVIGQGTTSGVLTLTNSVVCNLGAASVTLIAGVLNLNNYTLTCQSFDSSTTTYSRTLAFGSGTISVTSTAAATTWNVVSTNFAIYPGTGTVLMSNSGVSTQTFAGGSMTYNNLFIGGNGNYQLTMAGTNTFNTVIIDRSTAPKTLAGNVTSTVTALSIPVVGTTVVTITNPDFIMVTGVVITDYLSLTGSVASGGGTFYAGSHSTNVSGNSGWLFSDPGGPFPTATTNTATLITTTAATLGGTLSNKGVYSPVYGYFQYDQTGLYTSPVSTAQQSLVADGAFGQDITGLQYNTLYHFRTVVVYNIATFSYGGDTTFTTLGAPSITTNGGTNIASTTATLQGSLTSLGSYSSATLYFEYGTTLSYGTNTVYQPVSIVTSIHQDIIGLSPSQLYHFRIDALYNGGSIVNGSDNTFTTIALSIPAVVTNAAANVSLTSATLQGTVSSLGNYPSVLGYFEYGTTVGYGTSTGQQTLAVTGSFIQSLTGLVPNTTYHFRADISYAGGIVINGSDQTFATTTIADPTIQTNSASGVSLTAAILQGTLLSMGNYGTLYLSFEYGLTVSYGTRTSETTVTAATSFNTSISNLIAGTTYHYRATVSYDATHYINGSDVTFTTSSIGQPGTAAPDILKITDAKVVSGYLTPGDQLYLVSYQAIYLSGTPTAPASTYFVIQILNNSVVVGQWPLPQWGYQPVGLYFGTGSTLPYGGAYTIRIIGIPAMWAIVPSATRTLTAGDWLGTDLTQLDTWVIQTATSIGAYYSESLLTYTTAGVVLNGNGSALFSQAISGLSQVRPQLFSAYATRPSPQNTPSIGTAFVDTWAPSTQLGPYINSLLQEGATSMSMNQGTFNNLTGMGIWLVVVVLLLFAFKGSFMAGLISAPVLVAVSYSGLLVPAVIVVLAVLNVLLLLYALLPRGTG